MTDESEAPLIRVDGTTIQVTVTLGSAVSVFCDQGDPPFLVIDSGNIQVCVEPGAVGDPGMLDVIKDLTTAVGMFAAQASATVEELRDLRTDSGDEGWA